MSQETIRWQHVGKSGASARLCSLLRQEVRYAYGVFIAIAVLGTWSTPTFAAECQNQQLRLEDHSAELPDCRAFELISPPYKDGYSPFLTNVSPNGERVLYNSIGAFAGAKGNQNVDGTIYVGSRTSSGWITKAISPAASTFSYAQWEDSSVALDRTLWAAHTTSQSVNANDLYVREPNGSFVRVGPELPPSAEKAPPAPFQTIHGGQLEYSGASSDLSRVFFTIEPGEIGEESIAWLGDTTLLETSSNSLYEYSGVGNQEPKLVAVRNKGRLQNNLEAEMITQCGVELGGGLFASSYNAISSSGSTVYFTARPGECTNETEEGHGPVVKELYARVNESETVDISEPSPEDCEKCETSSREQAFFQGASEDGSKAYFLSRQEGLLPGAEAMNLYEYDMNGPAHNKLVRVSGEVQEPRVQGVARVSEDGSHVYFVAQGVLSGNKNINGEEATEGSDNLYVFDSITRTTTFVAVLSPEDHADWNRIDGRPVEATPDGDFLVFPSRSHLTADDHSGASVAQLFEYNDQTGELARISIGQKGSYLCPSNEKLEEGFNCDGNTENEIYAPEGGFPSFTNHDFAPQAGNSLRVSKDGMRIVFLSYDALAPQATNSLSGTLCRDAYEYRWSPQAGGMSEGNLALVSDGHDVTVSRGECGTQALMDPDGKNVLIESTDQLVSQDVDTQRDLYDARENGGFPSAALLPGCLGSTCHGALSAPPQLPSPTSNTQVGGGNVPQVASPVARSKRSATPTRLQKLNKALAGCRKKSKKQRRACESQARKKYGGKAKAKKSSAGHRHGEVSKGGSR